MVDSWLDVSGPYVSVNKRTILFMSLSILLSGICVCALRFRMREATVCVSGQYLELRAAGVSSVDAGALEQFSDQTANRIERKRTCNHVRPWFAYKHTHTHIPLYHLLAP